MTRPATGAVRKWRVVGGAILWGLIIALAVYCDPLTQAWWDRYLGDLFAVHVVALALTDLLRAHFLLLGVLLLRALDPRLPRDFMKRAAWVLLSQMLAAGVVKQLFGRIRPGAGAPVFAFTGPTLADGSYSFPSGHATVAFALAGLLAAYYPRWRWLLIALAALGALGRVDLGRHYIGDTVAGAVLGWYWAALVLAGLRRFTRRRDARRVASEIGAPSAALVGTSEE